jgi:long-chain acyl-CoA synthetase
MGLTVEFSTIAEMFDNLVSKFHDDLHPVLMHKVNGAYLGILYSELQMMVEHFGNGLASLGVKSGDTIGLISENRPEWVAADMGMMKLGAINVPLYPTLTAKQTEFIFNDAKVKFAIVSNQFQLNKILKIIDNVSSLQRVIVFNDKVINDDSRVLNYSDVKAMGEEFHASHPDYLKNEENKIKPDDLLTIIYTSGTTGNPKGVMLTHRNLASNIQSSAACIPFTHDDVLLSFLPLCHSYERMAGYYTAMACGATIAYAESIDTVRENMAELRPTVVTTVPRLFERIYNRLMKQLGESSAVQQIMFQQAIKLGRKYAVAKKKGTAHLLLSMQHSVAKGLVLKKIAERTGGRIRFFVSGGAALSRELGEFFEAVGLQIIEGYGMTESSPVISVNRIDDYKFGSVGKPIPGIEVKIADDGEILVRGPNVMKGYWNDRAATHEAIDKHGWLYTGDIGVFDAQGFLIITDRKKHLFVNSGGKNIAPQPIESLFSTSKFIDQFILIGDKRMFLTALIVPDFEALKDYAKCRGLPFQTEEELVNSPEIYELLNEEISLLQRDLAAFERVRKFTILSRPLTIENGEITPTLKVKRKVVEEKFKHLIEKMYEGLS